MSKHSGKIGLYLLLIVALIAGYLYLNDQVSTQGSYTMGQLERALEEDKVTDAVIHQNRDHRLCNSKHCFRWSEDSLRNRCKGSGGAS